MFGELFGVSETGADNGLRSTLANFFNQINVRQPIGRKESIQPSAEQ
jgi:hypothetical protein